MRLRGPGAAVAAVAVAAATGLAGCSDQGAADQTPAQVSGTVTSRPPCQPHRACPFLVALVPGALVVANGKDGVHQAHADAHGRYQIFLLEGLWTLQAGRPGASSLGTGVSVDLRPGQQKQVNLSVAG